MGHPLDIAITTPSARCQQRPVRPPSRSVKVAPTLNGTGLSVDDGDLDVCHPARPTGCHR